MHETDAEQVEAIKRWWKANGTSVLLGATIGFGLLAGWRAWQAYQENKAAVASTQYENVLALIQQDKSEEAQPLIQELLNDQPNSTYSVLTKLLEAADNVKKGEMEQAKVNLQWAMDNATLPELEQIARLRKARLEFIDGKLDVAERLAEGDSGRFAAAFDELRGDIAQARGNPIQAAEFYDKTLNAEGLSGALRNWVQLKRDNLGDNKESETITGAPLKLEPKAADEPAPVEEEAATEEAATETTAETESADPTRTEKSIVEPEPALASPATPANSAIDVPAATAEPPPAQVSPGMPAPALANPGTPESTVTPVSENAPAS